MCTNCQSHQYGNKRQAIIFCGGEVEGLGSFLEHKIFSHCQVVHFFLVGNEACINFFF